MSQADSIPDAVIAALRDAAHVCILTGAGISAESGVPTFRDAQTGLWAKYDPLDLATPAAFERDPELLWRWYRWRRQLVDKAQPNAAHTALVKLASSVPRLTLVTQNVDGLHQRAGSRDVIEFHGNLFDDRCSSNDCSSQCASDEPVPRCPSCGSNLRPGVVWFGEGIPEHALDRSFAAASDCDVFMSIGTSSVVYPAAGLADVAAKSGAVLIEVNPDETGLTSLHQHVIRGKAGAVMPRLLQQTQCEG